MTLVEERGADATGEAVAGDGAAPTRTPSAPRPPTMNDVARLAGVSHQTVSRVVNGSHLVSPATRSRVELAVRQLGYHANTFARALAGGRSTVVAVVTAGTGSRSVNPVSQAVVEAASAAGYFVVERQVQHVEPRALAEALTELRVQGASGLLAIGGHDTVAAALLKADGLASVVVDGDLRGSPHVVGADAVAGGRLATRHLLDLGHRDVVHLAGPPAWAEARGRLQGWRDAMLEAGLAPDEPLPGDWTAESGYAAGLELAGRPEVTAVFSANDQMALGLLRALAESGRAVPDDVSVVGYDDMPGAGYMIPPLTTVRPDAAAVAERAVALLHARLAAEDGESGLVPPRLVVRASTAFVDRDRPADGHDERGRP